MNSVLNTHVQYNQKIFNNKYQWYKTYEEPIKEMYIMMIEQVENEFPNREIDWNDKEILREFINVIYENSSKYISSYV